MNPSDTKLHQTAASAGVVAAGRRAAVATALLALVVGSCWLSAGVLADIREVPSDLDGTVATVAAGAVAAVLAVWCSGAALTALALVARAAGRTSATLDAVSTAMTPVLLRRAVAAALGVAVLGGAAAPALAAPPSAATTTATTTATTATTATTTATGTTTGGAGTAEDLTWPAAPSPPREQPDQAQAASESTEVVVRRGDTLWRIAERSLPAGASAHDVAASWPRWYRANRAVVGADPDLLLPGQRLVAPGAGQ